MYYNSKRRDIKKWLFNKHSKIYILIIFILSILAYYVFKTIDLNNQINQPQEESSTTDVTDETESSTAFIAENDSYMIKINKSLNFATVYKIDANREFTIVHKTFRCSVNENVSLGKLQITEKHIWRMLGTDAYGQYSSKVGNYVYLHSVPYRSEQNSTLVTDAYNNLGNPAKTGSVYFASADAKWIFEHCGIETVVEIYEDQNEQPELALPEKLTLPFGMGYDPSELESLNKVVKTKINYMTIVVERQVKVGGTVNLMNGVYAEDMNKNNITAYVCISGSVNTSVPGRYTLYYNIMDDFGTILSYQSTVIVTAEETTAAKGTVAGSTAARTR